MVLIRVWVPVPLPIEVEESLVLLLFPLSGELGGFTHVRVDEVVLPKELGHGSHLVGVRVLQPQDLIDLRVGDVALGHQREHLGGRARHETGLAVGLDPTLVPNKLE